MYLCVRGIAGADPGFQVRGGGAHLKKLRQKIIFFPILGIHPCIDFCLYLRCVYWFFVWICFVSVNSIFTSMFLL